MKIIRKAGTPFFQGTEAPAETGAPGAPAAPQSAAPAPAESAAPAQLTPENIKQALMDLPRLRRLLPVLNQAGNLGRAQISKFLDRLVELQLPTNHVMGFINALAAMSDEQLLNCGRKSA